MASIASRQDEYSARSQQRYAAALAAGHFDAEIVPMRHHVVQGQGGQVWQEDVTLARDEGARPARRRRRWQP